MTPQASYQFPANHGKVAVIMPAYNARATVRSAVMSVLAQSYTDVILFLVDDGSTDDTIALAKSTAGADDRLVVLRTRGRLGPAAARNVGLHSAGGCRWIAFLDSDDIWTRNKLEHQIAFAMSRGSDLVFSPVWRISEDGELAGKPVPVPATLSARRSLRTTPIVTSTVLLSTQRCGIPRMELDVGYDDFELWTRLAATGLQLDGTEEPLAAYRIRKQSVSARKLSMSKHVWTVLRRKRALGPLASAACYLSYALTAVVKHRRGRPRRAAAGLLPDDVLEFLSLDGVGRPE
jgi:teichuronic acid biosynthesis glycosyltransferase TuaG